VKPRIYSSHHFGHTLGFVLLKGRKPSDHPLPNSSTTVAIFVALGISKQERPTAHHFLEPTVEGVNRFFFGKTLPSQLEQTLFSDSCEPSLFDIFQRRFPNGSQYSRTNNFNTLFNNTSRGSRRGRRTKGQPQRTAAPGPTGNASPITLYY